MHRGVGHSVYVYWQDRASAFVGQRFGGSANPQSILGATHVGNTESVWSFSAQCAGEADHHPPLANLPQAGIVGPNNRHSIPVVLKIPAVLISKQGDLQFLRMHPCTANHDTA